MLRLPPNHLLACPQCQADTQNGFSPAQQQCQHCGGHFFDLAGMPCWFDTGMPQRAVWQNLYANAMERGQQNLAQSQALVEDAILPSTRQRLTQAHHANAVMLQGLNTLLGESGLSAIKHPEYANHDASHMLQYYELLLRDWAWGKADQDENHIEFNRISQALKSTGRTLGDTWVIGAGAGRLSVDMHQRLGADHTIALDANLVLITAAHRIAAQGKTLQLAEQHSNPQQGFAANHVWSLPAPHIAINGLESWTAIAGNAWHPPLKPGSFDTVVTPWFMDVNGREPADLIALVYKYLKPGGLWLNTGPLLYSNSLTEAQKLSHEEIAQLVTLAGFDVVYQNYEVSPYLNSPLAAHTRTEQIWTFAAIAPAANYFAQNYTHNPATAVPPWLVLPHLPIPKATPLNTHNNPVLEHLASLVDGQQSINTIANLMRPNLSADKDPVSMVRAAFLDYLLA